MCEAELCNACGSSKIHPWKVINGRRMLRCERCRLVFIYPLPSDDNLRKLYGEAYFRSRWVESEELAAKSVSNRMAIVEKFKNSGAILDVGCGTGAFLAEAKQRGWQTKGIEISEWAAARARQEHGLDVEIGDALAARFAPGTFDAVTFWDTLEHLRDPAAALRRTRKWLKPDGVVVVRVVNCHSYDAKTLGMEWRGWALPYHLFHFSPSSLQAALDSAGLSTLSLDIGVSTVFFRFLFAPIAFPSHHARLIEAGKRRFPRLRQRLIELAEQGCWSGSILRRLFPGPIMEAVARAQT